MGVLLGGAFGVAVIVFGKAKGRWGWGWVVVGCSRELDGFIEKRDLVHRPGTLRCS